MPLSHKGLSKLVEETGEVCQVVGKVLAYGLGEHPDGTPSLKERLEDEIGDLDAILGFVARKLDLDEGKIRERSILKRYLFDEWDADPANNAMETPR